MTDLISRQATIDYLMTNMNWHDEDGYTVEDADEKRAIITDLINGVTSAQPDRWIPVSERLPEKTGKYLVTVKNGNVYATAYCAMDKKFNCAAVAWMELPEPYKEEGDNER